MAPLMILRFDFQRDEVSFFLLLSHPTALSCITAIRKALAEPVAQAEAQGLEAEPVAQAEFAAQAEMETL